MKLCQLSLVLSLIFLSCDQKSAVEKDIEKIPIEIKVERFDKAFFEATPDKLPKIKAQYPYFFPSDVPDSIWIAKMQDPIWKEVYAEVQKQFEDFGPVKKDFKSLFQHLKFYFDDFKNPKIATVISEMDYNNKAIYTDSLIVVSLELYLGENHKFYQFPSYLKKNFNREQLIPDVVRSYALKKIPFEEDKTLIAKMIYQGKILYLEDQVLPEVSDAEKIGYTVGQLKWCEENEEYMWRYFVENEMLFNADPKLEARFILPAPFSKFYLEIDNESPGSTGSYIGWQIVRSYMKNNNVSLPELLNKSSREIFTKSKFKPKK